MSLIGLDIGSSSVKIAAYNHAGKLLALDRESVQAYHPNPGWWEVNPDDVWLVTLQLMRRLFAHDSLVQDPPIGMAISASGREAFPIDNTGIVLGPCIMAGDMRTCDLNNTSISECSHLDWMQFCGHVPERMDPICRLLWWRNHRPEIMSKATRFLGWHEFIAMRLTGRVVTDRSLAGRWLVYNIDQHKWAEDLLEKLGVEPDLLPEIQSWGTIIGTVIKSIACELGLDTPLYVGVGGFDVACAVLGSGVAGTDMVGLVSGSWEDLVAPITKKTSFTNSKIEIP